MIFSTIKSKTKVARVSGGSAFTLVETLVAIAIIMVAITGPFAATEHTITALRIARDHTIATFLAQEGIEIVHAERDKVYLHDCYQDGSCTRAGSWWDDFTEGVSGDATHNILRCNINNFCIFNSITSIRKYDVYNKKTALFGGTLTLKTTPSLLKLSIPPVLSATNSFSYVHDNVPITTHFSRKIYVSLVDANEIKVTSEVTWKDNKTNYKVIATDHLTSWYTQ